MPSVSTQSSRFFRGRVRVTVGQSSRCINPDRLRGRSRQLVEQVVVSEDDFQHALARVAGVVEVDAAGFELDRHAFEVLPLGEARWHAVLLVWGEREAIQGRLL